MKSDPGNPYPKGSPERKAYASARRSEALKRRWANDDGSYRQKMHDIGKAQVFSEEDRARRRRNAVAQWTDPETRERTTTAITDCVRARMADPVERARISQMAKAQYETEQAAGTGRFAPEVEKRRRAKASAIMKLAAGRLYEEPEWWALLFAAFEVLQNWPDVLRDPDVRAFHAERMALLIPEAAAEIRACAK
ncbi:hypothetical protein UFOVP1324_36 [uncultured Caudovirales phage]|uniref:Uncharacterized protein n=1 Tax=uncultured Caudovirales phage TaxID=2100421 RepID=A0A6J5RNX7_9CAUD|nr:hypothetical protein UFOVP1324_36 [uncultured Caudovirales phage]